MIRWTRLAAACGLAVVAGSAPASAQEGSQALRRFHVLIPDLAALEGADRNFGKDVAEELRELMASLPTHRPVERRAIERELDQLDLDMRELDCVLTRQLAVRMQAEVALCAEYREVAGERFTVSAVFWDTRSGESFAVESMDAGKREREAVARYVFGEFERYTRHLLAADNCETYAQSRQWERALANCDDALALNPEAIGTRYRRARILFETERAEEALSELERVLADDPVHDAALQLAGYVSSALGRGDDAFGYYSRYLELEPGNVGVRMQVAYQAAGAGGVETALLLIREGLEIAPENADLHEQLGGYAFALGDQIHRGTLRDAGDGSGALAPGAVPYFREGIAAYERVLEARGAETPARHLRSIASAYLRLAEPYEAAAVAERALEIHPEEPGLWSVYADAMRRTDRLERALDALDRVARLDPGYPNLGLRRGSWLVEAGRVEEAVAALAAVATADPAEADRAARILLAPASARVVNKTEYPTAIALLAGARTIPGVGPSMREQLDFWYGFAILQDAMVQQEARTLETARATLPRFRQVRELFQGVGDYPSELNLDIGQLRTAVDTFIEIQEQIIRRGG